MHLVVKSYTVRHLDIDRTFRWHDLEVERRWTGLFVGFVGLFWLWPCWPCRNRVFLAVRRHQISRVRKPEKVALKITLNMSSRTDLLYLQRSQTNTWTPASVWTHCFLSENREPLTSGFWHHETRMSKFVSTNFPKMPPRCKNPGKSRKIQQKTGFAGKKVTYSLRHK